MFSFKKLLNLLTLQERKRAILLFIMIVIMAMLDALGVASVMPFIAIIANPDLINSNTFFVYLNDFFNFKDTLNFIFFIGVLVFLILLFSNAFKALTTYAQLRFTFMREHSISCRLIEGYLHQPYHWFLNRNSSDLSKTILSEVQQVVSGALLPIMTIIAQGMVVIAMILLLIFIDPKLALIVGVILGIVYGLIFGLVKKFLSRIGNDRFEANKDRYKAVNEAFGAIKEVKLGGLENSYIYRFSRPSYIHASLQAASQVVGQLPRFALEAIAFGGLLLIILYLLSINGDFATALPILTLYAFAGYRLMPALQQIYSNLTLIRFVSPALDNLHEDFNSLNFEPETFNYNEKNNFKFDKKIVLNKIYFSYPNAEKTALKDITLTIPVRNTIGIVGLTGSGKTTTVDLILGLLKPDKGTICVDDKEINDDNRRKWQRSIGYVPQQMYLSDDTIAANIALGVSPENIDMKKVEKASRIANLHDFVTSELSEGYFTIAGERGIRLSGGQRQRIGIARALYHNPKVLILDEGTSALDNITEKIVMKAINNLNNEITIILIAHRLSTVRECDIIYFFNKGRVLASGSFDDLIVKDPTFRKMAGG